MMSDDIERISFSEEEIAARVRELGAQSAADYREPPCSLPIWFALSNIRCPLTL